MSSQKSFSYVIAICLAAAFSLTLSVAVSRAQGSPGVPGATPEASPGASSTATTTPTAAPKVAITQLTTHAVDAAAIPGFSSSFSGGLAAGGVTVIDQTQVDSALASHAGLKGCETTVCLNQISQLLKASFTARATVEALGRTTFRIEITITPRARKIPTVKVERRCDLCTLKEAREALSGAAQDAAQKVRRTWRPQQVTDQRQPPTDTPVKPGRVSIVQAKAGGPTSRTLLWVGVGALAGGAAAIIAGGVLLGIDGKTQQKRTATEDLRVYKTVAGGATLTTVGILAALGGGALVLIHHLRNRRVGAADSTTPERTAPRFSIDWDPRQRRAMVMGSFRF